MELLGRFHPYLVVEVVGHYRRLSRHWGLGPQSPIQVESPVVELWTAVGVCGKHNVSPFAPTGLKGRPVWSSKPC